VVVVQGPEVGVVVRHSASMRQEQEIQAHSLKP